MDIIKATLPETPAVKADATDATERQSLQVSPITRPSPFAVARWLSRLSTQDHARVLEEHARRPSLTMAAALLRVTLRHRRGSVSPNTWRAQKTRWAYWRQWMKRAGVPALNPPLHAIEGCLREAMTHWRASTLKSFVTFVGLMHQLAGVTNPFATPSGRALWRSILREVIKRCDGFERQAVPLTYNLLRPVLKWLDTQTTPIAIRNAAILSAGYDMLARSAELIALRIEDIRWHHDGSAAVLIRRSKTDPLGEGGAWAFWRPSTVERVRRWLQLLGNPEKGYLWRALRGRRGDRGWLPGIEPRDMRHGNDITGVIRTSIRLYQERTGQWQGPDYLSFSSHSLRVGAAQDLASAGISDAGIAQAGRWRSYRTMLRYIRHLRPGQGGMATLARLQEARETLEEEEIER